MNKVIYFADSLMKETRSFDRYDVSWYIILNSASILSIVLCFYLFHNCGEQKLGIYSFRYIIETARIENVIERCDRVSTLQAHKERLTSVIIETEQNY